LVGFTVCSLRVILIVATVVAFRTQAISNYLSIYLLTAGGQKIVAKLRENMWLKLTRLPVSYFDKTSSGETVSRVVNDTSIVKDLISEHFPQFITGMISIIGAIAFLLVMDCKNKVIILLFVHV